MSLLGQIEVSVCGLSTIREAAMKKCSVCEQLYEYESLRFCRFDGARLIDVSWDEAPTIRLEPHELPHATDGLRIESGTSELRMYRHG